MRTSLLSKHVWDLVGHGYAEPVHKTSQKALTNAQKNYLVDNQKDYEKALYFIQNCVDDSIFPKIFVEKFS
jgi:hypothetical protein